MIHQTRLSFCFLLTSVLLVAAQSTPVPPSGVQVEKVAPNSESEKAGLKNGDMILTWARGDSGGNMESPFDLTQVELEQEPRGAVVLTGVRNGEQFRWTMGPGSWGLEARPALNGAWTTAYVEGQQLADSGNTQEAARRWASAPAAAQPESSLVALWLMSRAAGLSSASKQWQEADSIYTQAIQKAAEAKLSIRAQLLRAWALSYQQRRNWADAEKYFNQALALCRQSDPQALHIAILLNDLASLARARGDINAAEKYFGEALAAGRQLAPGSRIVAASLHGLGLAAFEKGNDAESEQYYLQALSIREKLVPESLELAATLNNLGNVMEEKGDLDQAAEYHRRSLQIKEKLAPGSLLVANSLNNLGLLESDRGDLPAAQEYHLRALEIRKKLGPDDPAIIDSLENLGRIAEARSDLSTARKFYEDARQAAERLLPDSLVLARILEDLGNVALADGKVRAARLSYTRALKIEQVRAPGGIDVAWSLHNLGSLAAKTRRYAEAEGLYRQSVAIFEKLVPSSPNITRNLLDLGELASVRGRTAEAIDYFSKARAIADRTAPKGRAYMEALAGLAEQMRRKHQFQVALQLYSEALAVLESQVAHLGGSEEVRSEFRATNARYYRNYIDLLMQQGNPKEAFQVFERFRARSLLELLTEAHLSLRNGISPELLARERLLQQQLGHLANSRVQLLSGNNNPAQIASLQKQIDDKVAEYEQVLEQIRTTSPRYADLTQPRSLSVGDVQLLLDNDTLLLEYSLGTNRSYLWAISSKMMAAYTLPRRDVIKKLAREFYGALSARSSIRGQSALQLQSTAEALSSMILSRARAHFKSKRLLIVSDGALQYIPFAALPEPNRRQGAGEPQPLVLRHEIVSLPSASLLAALRREATEHKDNARMVAILADPVFDKTDVRVKPLASQSSSNSAPSSDPELLARSAVDAGLVRSKELSLPRLPFSRREALSILSLMPAGQATAALDFDASLSTATSEDLKQYKIVHFATHGLVDSRRPSLSGLVLSLVDRNGHEQDGFLNLEAIYNLDLPVELVVLSACETALGKEIDGEGLLGLTRGFMYARASRVMASLWSINDVATAELMTSFYAALHNQHMRFAAALRAAQIAMWKRKRWSAPYYWAAFQIQGDWN